MSEDTIYTKCLRCGRALKTTESKNRGYGNYCWHIHNLDVKKSKHTLFDISKDVNINK